MIEYLSLKKVTELYEPQLTQAAKRNIFVR